MGYYPIAFDVTARPCLVVGGGGIALRKVQALVEAGARVTVISPEIDTRIEDVVGVEVIRRAFEPGDTMGFALVFAATGNREVNVGISREASAKGIPVNVVDDPELCTFIVPAVVRRGDMMIAITTSAKAPAFGKRMRRRIEELIGEEYGPYVALLGEIREKLRDLYDTQPQREAAMNRVLDQPSILDLLREGRPEEAQEIALRAVLSET